MRRNWSHTLGLPSPPPAPTTDHKAHREPGSGQKGTPPLVPRCHVLRVQSTVFKRQRANPSDVVHHRQTMGWQKSSGQFLRQCTSDGIRQGILEFRGRGSHRPTAQMPSAHSGSLLSPTFFLPFCRGKQVEIWCVAVSAAPKIGQTGSFPSIFDGPRPWEHGSKVRRLFVPMLSASALLRLSFRWRPIARKSLLDRGGRLQPSWRRTGESVEPDGTPQTSLAAIRASWQRPQTVSHGECDASLHAFHAASDLTILA